MKKIYSYPKINLCLKVYKEQKNESKHKIDSVFFLCKKIKDVIYIKKSKQLQVIYKSKQYKIDYKDCLITKSLKYLKQKFNLNISYKIVVKKNIPIYAGLGGGSSNAACIINYLISKSKQEIALDLKDIALNLGSDIPFFLTRYQVARVKNYGDFVAKIIRFRPKLKVIFNKLEKYSTTKQIFDEIIKDKKYQSKVDVDKIINDIVYQKTIKQIYLNDLEPYILKLNPPLKNIIEVLRKNDTESTYFFTGSGNSIIKLEELKC